MQRALEKAWRTGLLAVLLAGCRENLGPASSGTGPDTDGPVVAYSPSRDTTVTAAGSLSIRVAVTDRTSIATIALTLVGTSFGFSPVSPNDRAADVVFPVPLGGLSGTSLEFSVRAADVLGNVTVTPTVTVVVQ